MNNYLIPANTKKGQLIFGLFRPFDLILFGSGILITLLFLLVFQSQMTNVGMTIVVLLPAIVTGFLVVPVPYYHNMLNVIAELIEFILNQRSYKWKGWCIRSGEKEQQNK